ncbi:MAG: hypothetical protein HOP19_27580 [Acidobacteria bacterium]|nr:hypothetical protein [Acidobacteriota bacterium]
MVKDEALFGTFGDQYVFRLRIAAPRISVRDLLRERVEQEVETYNAHQPEYFRGLVQPEETEQTLNGFKLRKPRMLNWQTQYDKALEAFQRNGFVMLVNERQVEGLDTMVEINDETTVTFLKLVPLAGG